MAIVFGIFFVVLGFVGIAQAEPFSFLSAEAYVDGSAFLCGGRSLGEHAQGKCWTYVPTSEIGGTFGPQFGRLNLGIGGSVGVVNGQRGWLYTNIDLSWKVGVGPVQVGSYILHQVGRGPTPDFTVIRECFSVGKSPLGLIGQNTKCGHGPWNLYWGPSFSVGQLGPIKANVLCATWNLNPNGTQDCWFAWIMSF